MIRYRIAAALLGVLLAGAAALACAYWQATYVHGTQSCSRCGVERTVDRRLWLWNVSKPTLPRRLASRPVELCAEHEWTQSGCWEIAGGFHTFGAPQGR